MLRGSLLFFFSERAFFSLAARDVSAFPGALFAHACLYDAARPLISQSSL